MSTTGILGASNVVFYHPLDDKTELTQSQTWTGSAGFTAGKIGSGTSAIIGNTFSFPGTAKQVSSSTAPRGRSVVKLTSTSALIVDATDTSMDAKVAVITGNEVTFGPATTVFSGLSGGMNESAAALSSTKVIAVNGFPSLKVRVITISGTDATIDGAEATFASGSAQFVHVAALSPTLFVIGYSTTSSGTGFNLLAGTVSGSTITRRGKKHRVHDHTEVGTGNS